MFYEPFQGDFGDDTGVNGMGVMCLGPGMHGTQTQNIEQKMGFEFSDSTWSNWSSTCQPGIAVCAIKTKVELEKESSSWDVDIGAITDVELYCCEY